MNAPVLDRLGAVARDHFDRPRNVGGLGADLPGRGVGSAGAADQGDLVRIEVQLEEGRVAAARFRAFGCPYAIAAASLLTELATGLTIGEAEALRDVGLLETLQVPGGREYVARIAVEALRAAIEDGRKRSSAPAPGREESP